MKLYNTSNGTVIEANEKFYAVTANWEKLVNDDDAFQSAAALIKDTTPGNSSLVENLLPVIGNNQELWACGVTYLRSKIGRQEESKESLVRIPSIFSHILFLITNLTNFVTQVILYKTR